jgi:hypothetical protein
MKIINTIRPMINPQQWGPINPNAVLRTVAIVALAALGIGIMYYLVKHTSLFGRVNFFENGQTNIEKTNEYKQLSKHVNETYLSVVRTTPGILETQKAVIKDHKFFNQLIYLSPNTHVVLGFFFQISDPAKLEDVYRLIQGLCQHQMMERLQSRDFLKIVNEYSLKTPDDRELANAVFDILTGNDSDLHQGVINRMQNPKIPVDERLTLLNEIIKLANLFKPAHRGQYKLKIANAVLSNPKAISLDPVFLLMRIDANPFTRSTPSDRLKLIKSKLTKIMAESVKDDPIPAASGGSLTVNRQKLRVNPWGYIQAVVNSSGTKIFYERENGSDHGGLWRDFVSTALTSAISDRTLFTQDLSNGKAYPNPTSQEDDKFRLLGSFLKVIKARGTLIGPIFDSRLYTAMTLLTKSELGSHNPTSTTLMKLAKAVWPDPANKDRLFKILEKGDVAWSDTETKLITDNLFVATYDEAVFTIYEMVPARALFAIAQGIEHQGTAEELRLALEGDLDRARVSRMIRYSGSNASILQQVAWLKEWLEESDENCSQFLYFATGSKGLSPSLHSIPINPLDEADQAFNAHTCSQTVDFSTRITYTDKAHFILVLKAAIDGDRGFNNT